MIYQNNIFSEPEKFYQIFKDNLTNDSIYPLGRDYWSKYKIQPRYDFFNEDRYLSIYIHYPFCVNKCAFCQYETLPNMPNETQNKYVDALLNEINYYSKIINSSNKTYYGFDIGGGTPTLLTTNNLERIWREIMEKIIKGRVSHDWTPSIETTAIIAAVDYTKLKFLIELGFIRLSMGIQTTETTLLRKLNRGAQSLVLYENAIGNARKAGFKKINVDIMYGLPQQSSESFKSNVKYVSKHLQPENISIYETRYYRTALSVKKKPDRKRMVAMYQYAYNILRDYGYYADYGSSYFSLSKNETGCSSYLQNRHLSYGSYIGIGAGSQGLTTRHVSFNYFSDNNLDPLLYIKNSAKKEPIQYFYELPWQEIIVKYISLSLYFHGFIDYVECKAKLGVDFKKYFKKVLEFALTSDLLSDTGSKFYITKKGFLNYYALIALFYSSKAQLDLIAKIS